VFSVLHLTNAMQDSNIYNTLNIFQYNIQLLIYYRMVEFVCVLWNVCNTILCGSIALFYYHIICIIIYVLIISLIKGLNALYYYTWPVFYFPVYLFSIHYNIWWIALDNVKGWIQKRIACTRLKIDVEYHIIKTLQYSQMSG